MIERVARALCIAHGSNPDKEVHCQGGAILREWEFWEKGARAAIAAMREPSAAIEDAIRRTDCWDPEEATATYGDAWRSAVDAALEEQP